MLQIENYRHVESLAEAYDILHSVAGSTVLGGCGYLRLGGRKIHTAIDLSRLGLDFIRETEDAIEIGAMTTLRTTETHPLTTAHFGGVLPESVEHIVGIQLRNCVTIGGTVAGRYPFSDPITALMALDARLELHHHGLISLADFLGAKPAKDILVKVIIPKDGRVAAFSSVRKSATDYAVLNAAAARRENEHRIVVGSRPGRAMYAAAAQQHLNDNGLSERTAAEAGKIAAKEIQFGDNPRGSGAYRKAICPVLVKRALMEVMNAA